MDDRKRICAGKILLNSFSLISMSNIDKWIWDNTGIPKESTVPSLWLSLHDIITKHGELKDLPPCEHKTCKLYCKRRKISSPWILPSDVPPVLTTTFTESLDFLVDLSASNHRISRLSIFDKLLYWISLTPHDYSESTVEWWLGYIY